MSLSATAIKAGQAYIEITATDAKMQEAFDKAKSKFDGFASKMGKAGAAVRNIGLAILAPMGVAVAKFMSTGDKFDKMSSRTGASVEWLSEMEFVASQAGTSIEVVENGMRKLSKSIGDAGNGTKSYVDALQSIGLSYDSLAGLSPEEQFETVADALSGIRDQSTRTYAAMTLMGRSATAMFPMFQGASSRGTGKPSASGGAATISAKRAEARSLGLTISKTDTDNAAALTDAWDVLKRQMGMAVVKIGSALAPSLIMLARAVAPLLSRLIEFIKRNPDLIIQTAAVAAGMFAAGTSVNLFAKSFSGIGTAISLVGKLAMCIKGIAAAFNLTAAVCVAFGTAVYIGTQEILDSLFDVKVSISDVVSDMFSPVSTECAKAFDTVKNAFTAGNWMDALSLSWEIVKLGASACWAYLQEGWEGIKYTVASAAYEAGYGVMEAYARISSAIEEQISSMCTTISGFFSWAFDGISERVETIANVVKRLIRGISDAAAMAWNAIKALDPTSGYTWDDFARDKRKMQADELKRRVDEDTTAGQRVSANRTARMEKNAKDYEEQERRRAQNEEYIKALDAERRRSMDALGSGTSRRMQEIQTELAAARERLKNATEKTNQDIDAKKADPNVAKRTTKIPMSPSGNHNAQKERKYTYSSDATAAFLASTFALASQTVSIKDIAKNVKAIRNLQEDKDEEAIEFAN